MNQESYSKLKEVVKDMNKRGHVAAIGRTLAYLAHVENCDSKRAGGSRKREWAIEEVLEEFSEALIGSGSELRPFLYVDESRDAQTTRTLCAVSDQHLKGAKPRNTYNLFHDCAYSIGRGGGYELLGAKVAKAILSSRSPVSISSRIVDSLLE